MLLGTMISSLFNLIYGLYFVIHKFIWWWIIISSGVIYISLGWDIKWAYKLLTEYSCDTIVSNYIIIMIEMSNI